jgi:hypothetical protein
MDQLIEQVALAAPPEQHLNPLCLSSFGWEYAPELIARRDLELHEHLVQVVLDRPRADEKLRANLGVRVALAGKLGEF